MALAQRNDMQAWKFVPGEQRVFTRVPFSYPVRWLGDKGDGGTAWVRDLSRSGVGLSLSRFLRPGPVVRVVFDGIEFEGSPIEMQATTVWSRPENGAPDRFVAGFKIVQGERTTLAAISEVFYTALNQYADAHQLH